MKKLKFDHYDKLFMTIILIMGIVCIILKLAGVFTCSWWWVLAPFWAPALGLCVMLLLVSVLYIMIKKYNDE